MARIRRRRLGVRDDLAASDRLLLSYAERVGDGRAAEVLRRRLDDIAAGRPVRVHGYQVGATPPGGSFTLGPDDQLRPDS